jgi:uncharacterized protein YyaL (SSP411 family)
MQQTDGIDWEHQVEAAFENAKEQHRLVFLDVFNPG